jgi:hypothetical protein
MLTLLREWADGYGDRFTVRADLRVGWYALVGQHFWSEHGHGTSPFFAFGGV